MISIFHPDSDETSAAWRDPRNRITTSCMWSLTSLGFLFLAWSRVHHLRATGAPVNILRWAQIPFWILMLGFYLWNILRNWRLLHANQSQSR